MTPSRVRTQYDFMPKRFQPRERKTPKRKAANFLRLFRGVSIGFKVSTAGVGLFSSFFFSCTKRHRTFPWVTPSPHVRTTPKGNLAYTTIPCASRRWLFGVRPAVCTDLHWCEMVCMPRTPISRRRKEGSHETVQPRQRQHRR